MGPAMVHRASLVLGLFLTLPSVLIAGTTGIAQEQGQEEWFFSTKGEFDEAAASMRIMTDQETTCTITAEMAGIASLANAFMITLEDRHQTRGFFLSTSSGSPVHAHGADIISTHDLIQDGTWAARYTAIITFNEWVDITAVGHDLAPYPEDLQTNAREQDFGDASIAFSAICNLPVEARLFGDNAVNFITPLEDDSGSGLWSGWTGGILIGAHAIADYEAPEVRFRTLAFDAQLATVQLNHPHGEDSWIVEPGNDFTEMRHNGGPGTYLLLINTIPAGISPSFYSFLAGFHPIDDLDELVHLPRPG